MDSSFTYHPNLKELTKNTLYSPFGTSIRLSEIGYTSEVQNKLNISLNSLEEYIKTMRMATSTVYPPFSEYSYLPKNQLNDFYLQIENEYYAPIRPKQKIFRNETISDSFSNRGILYLEVRCLDIDPFSPIGINKESLYYTHCLLLHCLLEESNSIEPEEKPILLENQQKVVWNGREPSLKLYINNKTQTISEFSKNLTDSLIPIANRLDLAYKTNTYSESIQKQLFKITLPDNLPSNVQIQKILENQISYKNMGINLSLEYKKELLEKGLKPYKITKYEQIATRSLFEYRKIECQHQRMLEKNKKVSNYA
jgi:glutamate--cysteine ligase